MAADSRSGRNAADHAARPIGKPFPLTDMFVRLPYWDDRSNEQMVCSFSVNHADRALTLLSLDQLKPPFI